MKILRLLTVAGLFFSMSILSTSCGNDTSPKEKQEQIDKSGPEYTSAYICPMHCDGSGSAEPGKCLVCGMGYVENKENAGHDHDGDDHDGHNHDGHEH